MIQANEHYLELLRNNYSSGNLRMYIEIVIEKTCNLSSLGG